VLEPFRDTPQTKTSLSRGVVKRFQQPFRIAFDAAFSCVHSF
jgi:hypothetical protein